MSVGAIKKEVDDQALWWVSKILGTRFFLSHWGNSTNFCLNQAL